MLDQRSGKWKARREYWLEQIPYSSEGRDDKLTIAMSATSGFYTDKTKLEKDLKRKLTTEEYEDKWFVPRKRGMDSSGTSVFDPVLAEIALTWFSDEGQSVLDPFAGSGTRGIMSGLLGRSYLGVDLSADQIAANKDQLRQAEGIAADVRWIHGDSQQVLPTLKPEYDLLFSCPPYFDLEKYSKDPDDLSNLPWPKFVDVYRDIISKACRLLRDDSFAFWVIGEVRDKKTGRYRGLVQETVKAFEDAGLAYYNEMILVSPLGGLPTRSAETFLTARKVGKCHQNVLVFVKGDPRVATERAGAPPVLEEILEDE